MTEQEKVVTDISDMDNFDLFNNSKEWNRFYKRKKKSSAVEWYLSWDELSPDIMPNLEILQSPNILVPACGNSRLSEQLYSSGFHNITSVDYSSELIKTMKNQHREKVGMQWLTKDVLAPLQESPILIPRSYDVILDKGCFDCLCLWAHHMNKGDKCLDQYLHNVKDLLGFRGKFIILTKLYWDNTLAFLYHRFWLGWKLTLQRVFPQKDDDEMAVMFVIEKCTNGLIYNIIQDDKSHKTLSAEVDQENKSIDNYRKRAKSKEDFELSLRGKGVESCCEVDDGDYRIIVLIDSNKFHDLKKVDVLWVPEDDLVLHSDALTNSKYWQLEHFFSTVTRASALLFIVLSPKLQLHLQSDTQMDKIRLDLKPLLETIDPKIQVGWLKMWNKEHQKKLTDIGFLPTPPSSKPTPQSSKPTLRSSKSSKKGSKESGTSKGKEKLEKDDNSFGKDLNEESIVVVGDLDKVDEVVDKVLDEVLDEKVDLIEQTSTGGMPLLPLDFPIFHDGDAISYYSKPFTLASWLKDHEKKEDRCLGVYLGWKDILPQVDCPNLLKRECLRIMQSIVLGVLDYHEKYGAHDGLHDWTNILITQVVINHIGSKMVRFETKLSFRDRVTFDDSVMILKKQGDMQNVLLIMEKLLEGVTENSELKYLGDLLFHYPYEEGHFWKTLLLKNYPTFWDGLERAEFLVTLYFHLVSNPKSSYSLKWSLGLSRQYLHGWMSRIPPDTIFEKILCGDDLDEDQCRVKKYTEGDITEVVRYMRATVHHFRENGGADLDLRYIEAALSHLFENYIMEIYSSMCRSKMFLL